MKMSSFINRTDPLFGKYLPTIKQREMPDEMHRMSDRNFPKARNEEVTENQGIL